MKDLLKVIILALLTLPALLYNSSQQKGLEYEFIQSDNNYSFRGRFMIFDFEHISNYASGAKSLEKKRQGENWYDVTYTYRKLLIFENQSTWRRTLKRNKGKVVFEMISSRNNLSIIPEVIYSKGYYQINNENEGYSVEYFQECKINPGILKYSYIYEAKKGAIKFLQEFKEYIEKTCD